MIKIKILKEIYGELRKNRIKARFTGDSIKIVNTNITYNKNTIYIADSKTYACFPLKYKNILVKIIYNYKKNKFQRKNGVYIKRLYPHFYLIKRNGGLFIYHNTDGIYYPVVESSLAGILRVLLELIPIYSKEVKE